MVLEQELPLSDLLGIAVGHLYHYASTRKLLRPPGFLKQVCVWCVCTCVSVRLFCLERECLCLYHCVLRSSLGGLSSFSFFSTRCCYSLNH